MRKPEWIERFRREAGAGLRLGPWLLLSVLLVLVLWQARPAALAGLFQSPPDDTPTVPATSTSEPTPSTGETATSTPMLTDTPVISGTPTITVTPTITGAPMTQPTCTPTVSPSETPTVTATPLPPTDAQVATPVPTAEVEEDTSGEPPQRYAEGESNLSFDWGMLFDAGALGLSYVWLCCGAFIVLGIPLFFLVLWVASSRRRRTE